MTWEGMGTYCPTCGKKISGANGANYNPCGCSNSVTRNAREGNLADEAWSRVRRKEEADRLALYNRYRYGR